MGAYGRRIVRCDLSQQYTFFRSKIEPAIKKVLSSGRYHLSSQTSRFEKEFANYVGKKFAIAVASGTDALILALRISDLSRGDHVIVPTYAPTPVSSAVVLAGFRPVFIDVNK